MSSATPSARVAADDALRAVVLTGAGRGFCAGQDLAEAMPKDGAIPDLGDFVRDSYNPVVRAIRTLEKPVICAVNGVAAGAGANIAYACDIVFAASTATFIQSFAKIGVIPDSGGTFILPRIVGLHRATIMTMLAEKMSAEQAREWGLVYMVTEPDALIETATRRRAHARDAADARARSDQARVQPLARRRPRRAAGLRGGAAARSRSHGGLSRRRERLPREAKACFQGAIAWR